MKRTQEERVQFNLAAIVVQRMWRGSGARVLPAHKIDVDYSIIILQSAARRWFAKRQVRRVRRHMELQAYIQREMEAEGMEAPPRRPPVARARPDQVHGARSAATSQKRVHKIRGIRQKRRQVRRGPQEGHRGAKKREQERKRVERAARSARSSSSAATAASGPPPLRRRGSTSRTSRPSSARQGFRKALAPRGSAQRRLNFALHYQHLQRARRARSAATSGRRQRATRAPSSASPCPRPRPHELHPQPAVADPGAAEGRGRSVPAPPHRAEAGRGRPVLHRGKARNALLKKAAKATDLRQGDAVRHRRQEPAREARPSSRRSTTPCPAGAVAGSPSTATARTSIPR